MGGENSKPRRRDDMVDEMSVIRAMELQKQIYDAKYAELVNSQLRIQQMIDQEKQNRINSNNATNPGSSMPNTLYPNLPSSSNNNLRTINNAFPSTAYSRSQQPSSAVLVQAAPSVPSPLTVASAPLIPSDTPAISSFESNQHMNRGAIPKSRTQPTNNNIQIGVECVTCKRNFGAQIYQCQNGHSSCNTCKFQKRCCGICSKLITDMRNITLEITIADIHTKENKTNERIKCLNAKDGCCLSFTNKEMENHLKECPYREMQCPLKSLYINCSWKGKINQILSHFGEAHPSHCIADVDQEMNLNNISRNQISIFLVNLGSFMFLINIKVNENDKMIYMTAQLMGTKVSAAKWTYEIHIYNKRETQRKIQYIDVCHSDSTSLEEIFDKAQCAVVSMAYAKTFFNNGCLSYKVYLKKNNSNFKRY